MFVSAWSRVSVNPKKLDIFELQFGTHFGADSVYTLRSFSYFCNIAEHIRTILILIAITGTKDVSSLFVAVLSSLWSVECQS